MIGASAELDLQHGKTKRETAQQQQQQQHSTAAVPRRQRERAPLEAITSLRDGAPKPAEHVCREKRTGFSKDWRVLPAGTDSIVHRGMYDAVGFVRLQK